MDNMLIIQYVMLYLVTLSFLYGERGIFKKIVFTLCALFAGFIMYYQGSMNTIIYGIICFLLVSIIVLGIEINNKMIYRSKNEII